MLKEQEIIIQTLSKPDTTGMGLVGIPVELTRIYGPGGVSDVSTIEHPTGSWFETVVFPLVPNSGSIGPVFTETRETALNLHHFTVGVVARRNPPIKTKVQSLFELLLPNRKRFV